MILCDVTNNLRAGAHDAVCGAATLLPRRRKCCHINIALRTPNPALVASSVRAAQHRNAPCASALTLKNYVVLTDKLLLTNYKTSLIDKYKID